MYELVSIDGKVLAKGSLPTIALKEADFKTGPRRGKAIRGALVRYVEGDGSAGDQPRFVRPLYADEQVALAWQRAKARLPFLSLI
jgi:hypothetical protein